MDFRLPALRRSVVCLFLSVSVAPPEAGVVRVCLANARERGADGGLFDFGNGNWRDFSRGYQYDVAGHSPPFGLNGERQTFTLDFDGRQKSSRTGEPKERYRNRFSNPYQYSGLDYRDKISAIRAKESWRADLLGEYRKEYEFLPHTVIVNTGYGKIQGFYAYLWDGPRVPFGDRPGNTPVPKLQKNISVFLGIPYGEPPVGEFRFQPPRPNRGWQLLQATDYGPACPQPVRFTGSTKRIRETDEDCLFLNVFTPTTSSTVLDLYPVIVYIHGGHFQKGASSQFPPHQLVAWHDLVVVTINYRLGALGFLSTADENSPGNYGMLDQALAIKWVHENIHVFNGNPDRIILMGEDAGAVSAGLHMVSPKAAGFVAGVIALGGSALADWGYTEDHYHVQNTSMVFGRTIGCTTDSFAKMVDCLKQGRSSQELGNHEIQPDLGTFPWTPVVDGNTRVPSGRTDITDLDWRFLPKPPGALLAERSLDKFPYMTGFTKDEASYLLLENKKLAPNYEVTEPFFRGQVLHWIKQYNYTQNARGIYEAIRFMYTYWPDPDNASYLRQKYIDFLSDSLYRAPIDRMVKQLLLRGCRPYVYHLNTTVRGFNLQTWRRVPHNFEYVFVTGAPFMDKEFYPSEWQLEKRFWEEADRNMSEAFLYMIANFVHGINWEHAEVGQLRYLNLNTTLNSSMRTNYCQIENAFWSEYLPAVVGYVLPIYPPNFGSWWQLKEPIQIGFWTICIISLVLLVLCVLCCCMWQASERNRKRLYKHYEPGAFVMRNQPKEEPKNPPTKEMPPAYSPGSNKVMTVSTKSSDHPYPLGRRYNSAMQINAASEKAASTVGDNNSPRSSRSTTTGSMRPTSTIPSFPSNERLLLETDFFGSLGGSSLKTPAGKQPATVQSRLQQSPAMRNGCTRSQDALQVLCNGRSQYVTQSTNV